MKRFLILFTLAGLASCQNPDLTYLQSYNPQTWRKTHAEDLKYPIPGHMDNLRRIYMNPLGTQYLAQKTQGPLNFPPGTILVKEIYPGPNPAPGTPPQVLTAMVKAPQDPRAKGGWLWVMKDPSTQKESLYPGQFCFDCHTNANEKHPYGDQNPEGQFRDGVYIP